MMRVLIVVVMVNRTLLNNVAPQSLMMVMGHNSKHHQHERC
jgi:Zn-dependent protease with chaperone function